MRKERRRRLQFKSVREPVVAQVIAHADHVISDLVPYQRAANCISYLHQNSHDIAHVFGVPRARISRLMALVHGPMKFYILTG